MTHNQKALLWREWALASKWLLAHGKTRADLDGQRHLLIRQACGSDLSMANWQRWTNSQVDRVLAKFRAVYDGGNLNAQMAANDQPDNRAGKAEAELRNLLHEIYPDKADEDTRWKRENILNAMVRKVCFKPLEKCSAAEIQKVIGIFRRQEKRNEVKAADLPAASEPVDRNDPF